MAKQEYSHATLVGNWWEGRTAPRQVLLTEREKMRVRPREELAAPRLRRMPATSTEGTIPFSFKTEWQSTAKQSFKAGTAAPEPVEKVLRTLQRRATHTARVRKQYAQLTGKSEEGILPSTAADADAFVSVTQAEYAAAAARAAAERQAARSALTADGGKEHSSGDDDASGAGTGTDDATNSQGNAPQFRRKVFFRAGQDIDRVPGVRTFSDE